jgi:hypothetical protein
MSTRGRLNSSITRVRPFFEALLARDPAGETWLSARSSTQHHERTYFRTTSAVSLVRCFRSCSSRATAAMASSSERYDCLVFLSTQHRRRKLSCAGSSRIPGAFAGPNGGPACASDTAPRRSNSVKRSSAGRLMSEPLSNCARLASSNGRDRSVRGDDGGHSRDIPRSTAGWRPTVCFSSSREADRAAFALDRLVPQAQPARAQPRGCRRGCRATPGRCAPRQRRSVSRAYG